MKLSKGKRTTIEGPETTPAVSEAPGNGDGTSSTPVAESRELLARLKRLHKVQVERSLSKAVELEKRAKDIREKLKGQERLRKDLGDHVDQVLEVARELGLDPTRPVTEVPALSRTTIDEVESATILQGRSYVRITFDRETNRYLYEAIEPQLTSAEREILEFLRDTLIRTMDGRGHLGKRDWETYLLEEIDRAILEHAILVDEVSKARLHHYLIRDFLGYGLIDVVMRDPMIEDISCDGPGIPVYVFHRQYESIRTNIGFPTDAALDAFVIRLAERCGKHISIAQPLLDATLPDTSRLQAALSREVTSRGSTFTIRRFRADPLTPPDLIRLGTMSAKMAAYFWLAMEEGQNVIMAGGTASGKTTTMNAIGQYIPPEKKVVSIEDTREINLRHENWIASVTRSGFGGDVTSGQIDMYKLLEAALRQRPEYLILGEVRGPEARTLFQAMATGHATYSTLHADSVQNAIYRMEKPPINVPRIMLQTIDAIAIQVLARRHHRIVRRIKELAEVVGIEPESGDLLTNTVFRYDAATDQHQFLGKSHLLEEVAEKRGLTRAEIEREWDCRTRFLEYLVDKQIRHIDEVATFLQGYYRTPATVRERLARATSTPEFEVVIAEMLRATTPREEAPAADE
ncbi:MAG: type II/IV secretion system ATPase subunit [Methanobacteriota archaeon]